MKAGYFLGRRASPTEEEMREVEMREVPIDDVFAATLPEDMDPHDPTTPHRLRTMVWRLTYAQYEAPGPLALRFMPIDWLITNNADEADAFQPAHDCAQCRAGAEQVRTFLAEHPDRWVVLANLHYVEVWRD